MPGFPLPPGVRPPMPFPPQAPFYPAAVPVVNPSREQDAGASAADGAVHGMGAPPSRPPFQGGSGSSGYNPRPRGPPGSRASDVRADDVPLEEKRTLLVRNIPAYLMNLAKLSNHFSQFGDVINVKVRVRLLAAPLAPRAAFHLAWFPVFVFGAAAAPGWAVRVCPVLRSRVSRQGTHLAARGVQLPVHPGGVGAA